MSKFQVGDLAKLNNGDTVIIVQVENHYKIRLEGNADESPFKWFDHNLTAIPKPLTAIEALKIYHGVEDMVYRYEWVNDMQKVLNAIKERGIA